MSEAPAVREDTVDRGLGGADRDPAMRPGAIAEEVTTGPAGASAYRRAMTQRTRSPILAALLVLVGAGDARADEPASEFAVTPRGLR
jgi:hypothetical protein